MTTPRHYLMRKKVRISIALIIILVFLGIGIGVKIHNDNIKKEEIRLVKLAKNTFKDIKSIKIIDFYESSPGTHNIDFDVMTITGEKKDLNSISTGSYRNNGLDLGKTRTSVQIEFVDGSKGEI